MIITTTLNLASGHNSFPSRIKLLWGTFPLLVCLLFGIIPTNASAQTFTKTQTVALNGGTGYFTDCANPGNKSITVAVAGVGTLNTTTNTLIEIKVTLATASSKTNPLSMKLYLKSPGGSCIEVASTMGASNFVATGKTFKYSFRNVTNTCLNNRTPDYVTGFSVDENPGADHSGIYGIFPTVGDMSSTFNTQNANGNWVFYFGKGSGTSSFPDVTSVSLTFGDAIVASTPSASGSSCADAVIWTGEPICLSTVGKVSTTNRPPTTSCGWLATSENNLWIAFQPVSTNACINISGIKKTGGAGTEGLQSIVVTDNNSDGDNNPCTPAGTGAHWTVVSCPRTNNPAIYSSDVGTTRSHNHCFTANTSKRYYLVVDGNANAQTSFYLTGVSALPVILPISLVSFDAKESHNEVSLFWTTESEKNNDYFTLLRSTDMIEWEEVGVVKGGGNSSHEINYDFIDRSPLNGISYYKLRQTDYSGVFEEFGPVSVNVHTDGSNNSVLVYPNPANGDFEVKINSKGNESAVIRICDLSGKVAVDRQIKLYSNKFKMSKDELQNGIYLVNVFFEDGSSCSTKLVVE